MKIFEYGDGTAENFLLQPVDDHDLALIENEIRLIHADTGKDFRLTAFLVDDWNMEGTGGIWKGSLWRRGVRDTERNDKVL